MSEELQIAPEKQGVFKRILIAMLLSVRERANARQLRYRAKHPQRIIDSKKRYRAENKSRISVMRRDLYHKNLEAERQRTQIPIEKQNAFKRVLVALMASIHNARASRRDLIVKAWRLKNIEKRRKQGRESMQRHPERNKKNYLEYRAKNKNLINERGRATYKINRLSRIAKSKKYQAENKASVMKQRNEYAKAKKARDPFFRLITNFRSAISGLVKKPFKKFGMRHLLGCDRQQFLNHLESRFTPGMNWGNYGRGIGKWSIDHILPTSAFDHANPEHQKRCWHFTNLQPLWFVENVIKSDKIPEGMSI